MILDAKGGGQVLRSALALSTITGKPFKAIGIRRTRPQPGLKAQHLSCINALVELCSAKCTGAEIGSDTIEFVPGKIIPQTLSIDIGTAGSITLLLQSILLPCCLAKDKIRLKIKGGTDVKWSIPIDYFLNVVLPFYCAKFKINKMMRGFYPKGQGLLDITIKPHFQQKSISIVRQDCKVKGISSASLDLRHAEVAKRQAKAAKNKLKGHKVKIIEEYVESASPGSVITVWTPFFGADALGERGRRAEAVGAEAGYKMSELFKSEAVVDRHLADNLVPLLGLVGGEIKTELITEHVMTNILVCEKFLDVEYVVEGDSVKVEL